MKSLLKLLSVFAFFLVFSMFALPAFAHVVVKPSEVGIGAYQTFTVGVPNEKDINVTSLRLVIPKGIESVTPNVKPGWNIEVTKSGDGEDAAVTEINWTGGVIPAGQRDDFAFSAKSPSKVSTVNWKAYQTYEDGTVVSWDTNPENMKKMSDAQMEKMEQDGKGPYSSTKIIDDLNKAPDVSMETAPSDKQNILAWSAIVLAVVAIVMTLKKK